MVLEAPSLLQPFQATGQSGFRRLTFVPATKPDAHSAPSGVDLIPLNETPQMPALANGHTGPGKGPPAIPAGPKQQRELFRESDLVLHWTTVRNRGAGYHNLGNTCFMNSVLQALAHTPPLAELFLSPRSDKLLAEISGGRGPDEGYDPVAATQQLVRKAFSTLVLAPKAHASSLRLINKRFRLGRQEDSHEFLRCLLDAMHEACLKRFKPKPPPELAATTFVYRIFGGRLRSQIECEGVDYVSRTYDPFLDLSLEINRAPSLERALSAFTAPEVLDGANKYRCPKNNKLVRAVKRISVEEAPNVLTVHLKRFEYGGFGAKINKKVEFDTQLDLRPYMSNPKGPPQIYDLYGVLVHHGHSVNSGHYICYVKAANGLWHVCDDHRVSAVGERTVLEQRAYILFYVRRHPRNAAIVAAATAAAVHQARTGLVDSNAEVAAAVANTEAGAALPRRQREQDAAGGPGADQPECQDSRNAKRARHSAPAEAAPVTGPTAHVGFGKVTGQGAASASRPVPKLNTALAHMLANLTENKEQLRMPTLKSQTGGKALAEQAAGEQQLKQVQDAQKAQLQGEQQQRGGDGRRQRASVDPHQNNLTESSGHGRPNGVATMNHTPPAKVAKFGAAVGAKSAAADDKDTPHREVSGDTGQQQQPELHQQQHVFDAAERSQDEQQNHRITNGFHQARRVSLLKPLRASVVCTRTSVWYATAGQLCHAGARSAAGNGKGRCTPSVSAPSAATADTITEDAGTASPGRQPRQRTGRCDGETQVPAVSQLISPRHNAHQPLEDKFDALGLPESHDQSASKHEPFNRQCKDDAAAASVANALARCSGPSTTGQLCDSAAGIVTGRKKASRLAILLAQKSAAASDGGHDAFAVVGQGSRQGPVRNGACAELEVEEPLVRQHKRVRQAVAEDDGHAGLPECSPASGGEAKAAAQSADAMRNGRCNALTQRQQPSAAAAKEVLTGQQALLWLLNSYSGDVTSAARVGLAGAGSSRQGSQGKGVDSWEGEDAGVLELRRQAAQLNNTASGAKRRVPAGGREYDEWDKEYDRGRTKKVRSRRGGDNEGDGYDGSDGEDGDGRGRRGSLLRGGFNVFQKAASEGWRSDSKDGPRQTPGSSSRATRGGRSRTPAGFGVRTPGR
ncbi:hypothetical protein Vretifemale_14832, partial [Volvox reticuliferus]